MGGRPLVTGGVVALSALLLAACQQEMTPELARHQCEERAHAAAGPTGGIALGVGSGGLHSRVEIGVSTDYLARRDPQQVFEDCYTRKTGLSPHAMPASRTDGF